MRAACLEMWPVYVINMASNPDRMAACSQALDAQGIGFERFEAVDGRALSAKKVQSIYDQQENKKKFRQPLIGGELGCYLSHIGVWEKLLASDAEGAIVLEDDFAAEPHLVAVLNVLSKDQGDWDLAKLYSRRPEKKMLAPQTLMDGVQLATPFQVPNTTLGYVLRRSAAKVLLKSVPPIARPIDEDHKRFWEHGLDIRLVLPPPLKLGEQADSDASIEHARKSLSGFNPAQGWRNLKYRVQYLAALYFHRILKP